MSENDNRVATKAVPSSRRCSVDAQPSPEASLRAAAILEVLAGQRTATEAAEALGVSLNHYYLLERKALAGLTAACELQPKGPKGPGAEAQLKTLQRELEQCQRECLRQTALVRATQRALGLSAAASAASGKKSGKKGKAAGRKPRKRRPQVRALRAAEEVRKNCSSRKSDSLLSATASGLEKARESTVKSPDVKEPTDGAQG
jgi:hypothetical protein